MKYLTKVEKPQILLLITLNKFWGFVVEYSSLSHSNQNGIIKCIAHKSQIKWMTMVTNPQPTWKIRPQHATKDTKKIKRKFVKSHLQD